MSIEFKFDDDWGSDLYYHATDKYGLEVIAEIEDEPDYDFDIVMVWRHTKSGEIRWGSDSGCSCPCPFENIKSWNELNLLPDTWNDLQSEVESLGIGYTKDELHRPGSPTSAEKVEFLQKVHKALKLER